MRRWVDVSGVIVHDVVFTVEPSSDPCSSSGCGADAVTQTNVDSFYNKGQDPDYFDARDVYEEDHCDLIPYWIKYNQDFIITKDGDTWILSGGGSARLGIREQPNRNFVGLADYTDLPFEITVSTSSFSAPPKAKTLTTLWGDIRTE